MSENPLRPLVMVSAVLAASACASARRAEINLDGYYRAVESRREAVAGYSRSVAHLDARLFGCRTIDEVPFFPNADGTVSPLSGAAGMTLRQRFQSVGLSEIEQRAAYMNYRLECNREELRLLLEEPAESGE